VEIMQDTIEATFTDMKNEDSEIVNLTNFVKQIINPKRWINSNELTKMISSFYSYPNESYSMKTLKLKHIHEKLNQLILSVFFIVFKI